MTVSIPTRNLGSRRLKVSALGLGCMTMTDVYGPGAEASAVATIDRALELGVFFLDTADTYADGANERLVGQALTGRRDRVCLATKFGFVFPTTGGAPIPVFPARTSTATCVWSRRSRRSRPRRA